MMLLYLLITICLLETNHYKPLPDIANREGAVG